METKDFALKIKGLEDSGSFTGYAAAYGDPPDLQGDVIEPGAFRQAIAQQGKGFPLLWSHLQSEPIGLGRVEDARDGLVVHGALLMSDPAAVRAHSHLKMGSIRGLSIGYKVPKGEGKTAYRDDGARVLKEVHLMEISLVAVPANPRAQITAVKSVGDIRQVLRTLADRDVGEVLDELIECDMELKRLLISHDPREKAREEIECLREFAKSLRNVP